MIEVCSASSRNCERSGVVIAVDGGEEVPGQERYGVHEDEDIGAAQAVEMDKPMAIDRVVDFMLSVQILS